jgi:electron transport complex protein RnfC
MKKLSGVRVQHRKHTADKSPQTLPLPAEVTIPLSMHIGAPAALAVQLGDKVAVGQPIGEASGFVSAAVHSSVSGTVKKITELLLPSGVRSQAVVIESDGLQTPYEGLSPQNVDSYESFLAAVRGSGMVGLGGAGFPTSVKLSVKDASKIDTIIINGAECEPYITSDTRTMVDKPELIIDGAKLLMRFFPKARVIIGIEENKPEPIRILSGLCKDVENLSVGVLPSLYPQGAEKVIIYSLTGKIVPEGGLPLDVDTLVLNCTTLELIMLYINTGMPLVQKCVTVDGSAVSRPGNIMVPIGTPVSELLDFCGVTEEASKVLIGGPMMGLALDDTAFPVLKNCNAILALNARDAKLPEPTNCIRCGRCVKACPMRLMPLELETAYNLKKPERLEELKVNLCMECGCCAYTCPAARPLAQVMKLSKLMLRDFQDKQKSIEKVEEK